MFSTHLTDYPRVGGFILTAIYVPFGIGLTSVRLYECGDVLADYYTWYPKTTPEPIDIRTILRIHDALNIECILQRCNYLPPPSIPDAFFYDDCLAIEHSFEDLITIEGKVYKRVQFENRPIISGIYYNGISPKKWFFYSDLMMSVHTALPEEDIFFYTETLYFENMHQEFPPEVNAQFPTLATCMKEWGASLLVAKP